ncbi:TetR/AcrR family transcriptional regulator [Leucobacter sp. USHLN153]|uniref:TetR/AcrR family transcriptional regulator n=1 Tax=Leucobacter sp. USHLN153 TaxID=3081268 RepID=UPI0030163AC1
MRNTLADVISTAVRVLDAQGLEGCSMRRVAAELDVQPSALYHHVPNKQSLLALMADAIVAGVLPPSRGGEAPAGEGEPEGEREGQAGAGAPAADAAAPPAERARHLCLALRGAMLAVRDGAEVVATAAAFRLGDSLIESRLAALVGGDGARTLLLFTCAHAQSTQTHRQAAAIGALGSLVAAPVGSPSAPGASPARGDGAPAAADPAADLDASFERGLDIIIAGLTR